MFGGLSCPDSGLTGSSVPVCMCVCVLTGCCREHSSVSTQHVGWVWWIPGIVGSYLWCAYNHNSPATAYCRVKLSEIYSEAGIKPLDFVIIHRPKSLPCTHRAIFIPRWMYFLRCIIAQAQGRNFLFWERVLVFQTFVKSGEQFSEFVPWSHSACWEWCMQPQRWCLFLNFMHL